MIGKSPTLRLCRGYPDKPRSWYTRGARESALCRNSQNSGRAPALDWTIAQKTLTNPNGFQQIFHAWATSRTPDRLGSPPALRTSPLSLLYKDWIWKPLGGLNLTFFTLFAGGSTMVFIGGVRRCSGQRFGAWGPLVRLAIHATWPSGQVSSLHCLWDSIPRAPPLLDT
jgi:hypothetical protein